MNSYYTIIVIANRTMKTHYSLNTELNCANVCINDRVYLIEIPDLFKILNNEKKFVFVNFETEEYPSFLYNYKRVNYLQFIFNSHQCMSGRGSSLLLEKGGSGSASTYGSLEGYKEEVSTPSSYSKHLPKALSVSYKS